MTGQILDSSGRIARYSAAYPSRARAWRPQPLLSPNRALPRYERTTLIGIARDLYDNDDTVKGIITDFLTYSIGSGLVVIPTSSDANFNYQAKKLFSEWGRRCDLLSLDGWAAFLRRCAFASLISGDGLIQLTYGESGFPRLLQVESENINNPKDAPSDGKIIDGVQYGNRNRIDGYWVATEANTSTFLPTSDCVYFGERLRPGQGRAPSGLHAVINTIIDLQEICDLEKIAVKDVARHTKIIELAQGSSLSPEDTVALGYASALSAEERATAYQAAMGAESVMLSAGDKFTAFNPSRPSPAWTGFVDYLAYRVCRGLGLPGEYARKDKLSGTVTRAVLSQAGRRFAEFAELVVISQIAQPIYEWVIDWHIVNGLLPSRPKDWNSAVWHIPPPPTTDYGREAQQDREDVRAGLLTRAEYAGRWQQDWREQAQQAIREQKAILAMAEAEGLDPKYISNFLGAKPGDQIATIPDQNQSTQGNTLL